ncbi:MAG: tRNA (adenosine(37)-N6)-threonylcarbamoyltransferase complex dimerization subunit type 1 TsaB [Gammaproteobacteria bacterium]|nr:tRNA (adenosine(37)-N6)-threonylcarbamoyltransferase complex dimerization subunit type 1 TsaB [Gammaproteobacteria bacterium]
MTRLLAVETSAEACSVALHCRCETRIYFEHAPMRHAELLLPAVKMLLEQEGVKLNQLDAIAFGRGPGSFTSLRIGIGVVQGLAWGAGLPVVPVSSLAAAAQDACDAKSGNGLPICVALDARMNEVYTANFRCGENGIVIPDGEERVCAPDRVSPPQAGPYIAAGNGFERFTELAPMASAAAVYRPEAVPKAETLCQLALNWLTANTPLPAGLAQPVYLRNKVASKPAAG